MKRINMLAIAFAIGILLPLSVLAQLQVSVALTPEAKLAQADAALREAVAAAMEQVAVRFGMTIDARDMIYVSRDDLIMASAGEAHFHLSTRPSTAAVETIALGLIYLSEEGEVRFGDGIRGRIPAGFHAVRVRLTSSSAWMEAYDEAGRVVAQFPVTPGPGTTIRKLTASLDIDVENEEATGCLDWHGRRVSIKVCITFSI